MLEKVIIIGSGPAGLTAAIYASRSQLNPLVIEGNWPGGQLTMTSDVENFPGFPEGMNGYELMSNFRKQAEKFGARFLQGEVEKVDFLNTKKESKSIFVNGNLIESKTVIITTGANSRFLGLPKEKDLLGGKGVSVCATCDGMFYKDKPIVVLGGGDSACEEALFLTHFSDQVFLVHRRDKFRASAIMANKVTNNPKIKIVWNSIVQEFLTENDSLNGIIIKDTVLNKISKINCACVFLAIGHVPNTKIFEGQLPLDSEGYIKSISDDGLSVKTSVNGVFAAGDCMDKRYKQAIVASGLGCQAAIEAEKFLA